MITISKYTDSKTNEYAYTQNKLNTCFTSINTAIDNYTEEETVQTFQEFSFDGSYYTGMQKELPSAPVGKYPVLAYLSPNYRIMVGYLSAVGSTGYFYGTAPMTITEDFSDTIVDSETEEEYAQDWSYAIPDPPEDTLEEEAEDFSEEKTYNDETIYEDEGTITHYTKVSYDVTLEEDVDSDDETIYRYSGTKTTTIWDVKEYTRTVDMNRDIEFSIKYRSI